jgi:DNA-directed RNA polymerase specialized sigma24 family protein
MKRNPYWKDRLTRWQLWVYLAPGGSRSAFYTERVDCAQPVGALTPQINDEAVVTDQLVAQLPDDLRRAVKAVYLDLMRTRAEIARRLHITKETLHNHLCYADCRLETLLEQRQQPAPTSIALESASMTFPGRIVRTQHATFMAQALTITED